MSVQCLSLSSLLYLSFCLPPLLLYCSARSSLSRSSYSSPQQRNMSGWCAILPDSSRVASGHSPCCAAAVPHPGSSARPLNPPSSRFRWPSTGRSPKKPNGCWSRWKSAGRREPSTRASSCSHKVPSSSFVDLYVPCHVHCVVRCSVQSAGQHTDTNRQQPFLHVVAHHTDARLCTQLACCSAPLFIRFVLVWLVKSVCM